VLFTHIIQILQCHGSSTTPYGTLLYQTCLSSLQGPLRYQEAMHCQPKSLPSIPLSSTFSNCWIRHMWSSTYTRRLREHGTCLHCSASVVWSRASQTAHRPQRNVEWRHPVHVSCNKSFLNDAVRARSTLYSGWQFSFDVTLVGCSFIPETAATRILRVDADITASRSPHQHSTPTFMAEHIYTHPVLARKENIGSNYKVTP